jgi:cation:H+ antiporter
MVKRDGGMLVGTTLLLAFFMRDLAMSRLEGSILMGLLFLYVAYLIYMRQGSAEETPTGEFQWYDAPRLIAGLVIVVISGHFFVEAASDLARLFGLSEWVIGVTIVAIGTSAPEIATSLIALIRGNHGISAGNLIGSDLFNLLGVLGLAAVLHPMTVDPSAQSSILVLVGMVILVVIMMRTGWRLSRAEGGVLVLVNVVRWAVDFMG